jgi:hypothetical protein
MKFGYCISAKDNKTTLIIDILLLQALKARISEERQARDVEITSLRMQSKRDIAALEAKLALSSSQYVMIQIQLLARHSCFCSLAQLKKSLLVSTLAQQNAAPQATASVQMSLQRAERVLTQTKQPPSLDNDS